MSQVAVPAAFYVNSPKNWPPFAMQRSRVRLPSAPLSFRGPARDIRICLIRTYANSGGQDYLPQIVLNPFSSDGIVLAATEIQSRVDLEANNSPIAEGPGGVKRQPLRN